MVLKTLLKFYVSKYVLIAFKSVLKFSKGFVNTSICRNNRNTLKIASKYYKSRNAKAHIYYENPSKTECKNRVRISRKP